MPSQAPKSLHDERSSSRQLGLEFTAHRLAVQLDLLIKAIEEARPVQEIEDLCQEGRVVLEYASVVLGGDDDVDEA